MGNSNEAFNLDELLSHKGFMRAIALGLLKEEHLADDAVQEAWLAVLKKPPVKVRSLRDWMITVVRNVARKKIREESRRRKREKTAASSRPTLVRPASEIVEKEMTRRRVVTAVLTLKEPNRSTLLYRFYDGMTPREIAELYEISIKTVQGRIQRGLDQVRRKLEAKFGGDKKTLYLALMSLAGFATASEAGAGAVGSAAGSEAVGTVGSAADPETAGTLSPALGADGGNAGSSGMHVIGKIGLVACLIMGAILTFNFFREETIPLDQQPPAIAADSTERAFSAEGIELAGSSGADLSGDDQSAAHEGLFVESLPGSQEPARTLIEPTRIPFSGRILDRNTGEPVRACDFLLYRFAYDGTLVEQIHDTIRDDEARFSYFVNREGDYKLRIRSSRHKTNFWDLFGFTRNSRQTNVTFTLDPGLRISGCAVDDITGEPLPDVIVGSEWTENSFQTKVAGFGSELEVDHSEAEIHARTDASGRFTLSGLKEARQTISGIHPHYAQSWISCDPREDADIVIRMKRGHRVLGRISSGNGEPVECAAILMEGDGFPLPRLYHSDARGRFETESAQAGKLRLLIYPRGDDIRNPGNRPLEKWVELADRDVEVDFVMDISPDVCWQGTLLDSDGKRMRFGTVALLPESFERTIGQRDSFRSEVDRDGQFLLADIPLGKYRLTAHLAVRDRERLVDMGYIEFDVAGVLEKNLRISGTSVSGVVVSDLSMSTRIDQYSVIAKGGDVFEPLLYHSNLDESGRFLLAGLKPGRYTLKVTGGLYNHYSLNTREIVLKEGQVLTNIELSVSWVGKVRFKLIDFENFGYTNSILSLSSPMREFHLKGHWLDYFFERRVGEITLPFEAGSWTLSFSYRLGEEIGYLERLIQVDPGITTEVAFSRKDLVRFMATRSVKGRLLRPDGSPVKGADVTFVPTQSNCAGMTGASVVSKRVDRGYGKIKTTTDDVGEFEVGAIAPGPWDVLVNWSESASLVLKNRRIPAVGSNPHSMQLALPGGMVSGRIVDARRGHLLGNELPAYRVAVFPRAVLGNVELQQGSVVTPICRLSNWKDEKFRIIGLDGGQYSLVINVPGYALHECELTDFKAGEQRFLGALNLEACGSVELELIDEEGNPPELFHIICNGELYNKHADGSIFSPITKRSPTRLLCDKLPLGFVTLEVRAPGFESQILELHLKPGENAKAKLVLQPK